MTQSRPLSSARLVILLLIAWGLLTFRLSAPWYGVQDSFRVWVASAVRNYDLYGVDTTGLMVTRNSEPVASRGELTFYSHHPPLIAWLPYVTTRFLGNNEFGVRYGFACVTLISMVALYVLARRLYGEKVAFWSAAFYGLPPMIAYFGRVPGHDQIGMMASLLFGTVLINWLRRPNRARLLALIGLTWLAVWSAWPAVFFIAVLGMTAMIFGNRSQKIAVVGLGFVSIIAFVVMMAYYQLVWSGSINSLLDSFVWRSSSDTYRPGSADFTLPQFFTLMTAHLMFYATPGLLGMGIIGLWALRRHGMRFANGIVFALFAASLLYQLTFRNASYIHDFYKMFFMPSLGIAAAMAWVYTRNNRRVRRISRPILDGMLLSSLLAGAFVWGILHYSGRQPLLHAVITGINTYTEPDDTVIIYFDYIGYEPTTGYDRVVMFYTSRKILWGIPLEEVLAMQTAGRKDFVYCAKEAGNFPSALFEYDYQPIYGGNCTLFFIGE